MSARRVKVGAVVLVGAGAGALWLGITASDSSHRDEAERPVVKSIALTIGREFAPYHDEHGDHTPRSKNDPRNARIRGCVSRGGTAVAGVTLEATVWPTGMSWTTDHGVTAANGCYEIVITARHFHARHATEIVAVGDVVGRLMVEAQSGRTTDHADIEVGAGFLVRGIVKDQKGAPVSGMFVADERIEWEKPTDRDGGFAFLVRAAGRHRLRVFPPSHGNIPREFEQTTPVMFDVDRLDGEVGSVTLVIGEQVESERGWIMRRVPRASHKVKLTSLRPDAPLPEHGWCTAWSRGPDGQLQGTEAQPYAEVELSSDTVRITCGDLLGFEDNGRDIDVSTVLSPIEIPVVPIALNGVELGVALRSHVAGALVVGVAAEAAAAGLRAGDIVTAVDGISVVGFSRQTIYEFGFNVPPGREVDWTIERDGVRSTLHAKAPGASVAPIFLR